MSVFPQKKIYNVSNIFINLLSFLLLSAAFMFIFISGAASVFIPPRAAFAYDVGGMRTVAMSECDYLSMLANQYFIDYGRARSLKAKLKIVSGDSLKEAEKKYDDAKTQCDRSFDSLLRSFDSMVESEKYLQVGIFIDGIRESYPSGRLAFKPVIDGIKENLKFRLAAVSDSQSGRAAWLFQLYNKVILQEAAFNNKKSVEKSTGTVGNDKTPAGAGTGGSVKDDCGQAGVDTCGDKPDCGPALTVSEKTSVNSKKKWTFMVYMNADNDLESAGIKDINEMEKIGSNGNINIIVQCDRSPEYDESNGNWIGARRFYIQKDDDFEKINSGQIADLGNSVDMGDPAVLADFIKWGVKNYPAEKYAVVIWNHGSGWKYQNARFSPVKGISYDESSGNHLDNFKLTSALEECVRFNGGRKFEMIIMDACLMAMIEIAYQIKDSAKVYIASEEVAPADGMPYDTILEKLSASPFIDEKEFAALIVEDYVRSYKGGTQGWSNCTFSAFDLSAIDALAVKIDALSKYLKANYEALSYPILLSRLKVLKYSDADYADLYDFCELLETYSNDGEVLKLCGGIMDAVGRPDMRGDYFDSFNSPVVITGEEEGVVRWTINDKAVPPAEYIGAASRIAKDGSCAETPLIKNTDGVYSAAIGPFAGALAVLSVQYSIVYKNGRAGSEKIISSSNSFFTRPVSKTGSLPFVIAEGHSQSLSLSHGVSIYLTPFEDYLLGYKNLDFSKNYSWSSFISHKPPFKTSAGVLVVPDTGYAASDLIYSKFYHHALAQANINYDLYLPAIYGGLEEEVLSRYKDGVVIWYTAKNSSCLSKYERHILKNFIESGGRVFINGQNIEQHHGLSDFFTGTLGVLYVEDSPSKNIKGVGPFASFGGFDIGGSGGADNVSEPSIFNLASSTALAVFNYGDSGAIAGIRNGSVLFCGFSFESIASAGVRARFIKAVTDELLPAGEVKVNIMDKL